VIGVEIDILRFDGKLGGDALLIAPHVPAQKRLLPRLTQEFFLTQNGDVAYIPSRGKREFLLKGEEFGSTMKRSLKDLRIF